MRIKALGLLLVATSLVGCAPGSTKTLTQVPSISSAQSFNRSWVGDINLESAIGITTSEQILPSEELQNLVGEGSRYQALKDVAMSFGTRVGLYQRRKELNAFLIKAQPQLDRIFNFAQYMLPGNVFPPVMSQAKGMIQKNSRSEIELNRHSYHMLTPPELMIEPPSYLNYLIRHYPVPELPQGARLPRNKIERENWKAWVSQGWNIGRRQADLQYKSDLRRLQRDLKGIRLFHDLVAREIISMPRLTKQDFGVVVSKDGRTLTIGDAVTTIVKDSQFKDSSEWQPIIGEEIVNEQ